MPTLLSAQPTTASTLRAGIIGGLVGGVGIWIYELVVWVHFQHILTPPGMLSNAVGLTFGKHVQQSMGTGAYFLGTAIHYFFAIVWGVIFAAIWPFFRRRGYEATLIALFIAVIAWVVMHAAISIAGPDHPNYTDPNVIIGGFMSHICFAVPMALTVKRLLAPRA